MAWRGVHISETARLSLDHRQLLVEKGDDRVFVAVEDLAFVVIDTPQATITTAALCAVLEAGAVIVQCGKRHLPTGLALPFHSHHRQAEIAKRQISTTMPFRKRAWQSIVRQKIENQAAVLDAVHRAGGDELRALTGRVASGDPRNVEAQAARFYWTRLFPDHQRGDDDDYRNALLNYGYAIVRACIARSLVSSGLLPSFGLHHDSASNAFNLADDIIEPFRPIVDHFVFEYANAADAASSLSVEDRRELARVPFATVLLGADELTLLAGVERSVQSLTRAISAGNSAILDLPHLPIRPIQ